MHRLVTLFDTNPLFRILVFAVFVSALFLCGLVIDVFTRKVTKVRQHILSLIDSSPAKAQYESRLKRIESGDFTHLS